MERAVFFCGTGFLAHWFGVGTGDGGELPLVNRAVRIVIWVRAIPLGRKVQMVRRMGTEI